jgi:hypothetical protein
MLYPNPINKEALTVPGLRSPCGMGSPCAGLGVDTTESGQYKPREGMAPSTMFTIFLGVIAAGSLGFAWGLDRSRGG